MKEQNGNGFAPSIAQAIEEMKAEQGDSFSLERIVHWKVPTTQRKGKAMKEQNGNGFAPSIAQAIEEMKAEQGDSFSLERINLAELERRTGVSRSKKK